MKKHNRIIAGIMAVCLMGGVGIIPDSIAPVVSVIASAEDYTYENLTYTFLEDGTIEITDFDNSATDVVIPEKIDGIKVTSIGEYALWYNDILTSVTIPDSVTNIAKSAFKYCENLTSLILSDGIVSIGNMAFQGCTALKSITIPESVTTISVMAFDDCTGLEEIKILNPECDIWDSNSTISNTATIYGYIDSTARNYAKEYNRKFVPLEGEPAECLTYEISEDGTIIVTDCNELATKVVIPDEIDGIAVTGIKDYAFKDCYDLKSIDIPESITYIGNHVFSDTQWLKDRQQENPFVIINNILIDGAACSGDIIIPDEVTTICAGAFTSNRDLLSVTINDGIKIIDEFTFMGCNNLESVKLPESLTYISLCAFNNCTKLKSIIIPKNVTTIRYSAFNGCKNLSAITFMNPECQINNTNDTISETATIYGYIGSTAQDYARRYDRNFVAIDSESSTSTTTITTTIATTTTTTTTATTTTTTTESKKTGDLNGDNEFNVSDVVSLQKYILGASDTEISDWKQADLNDDGILDVFDLCLMKKKLIEK